MSFTKQELANLRRIASLAKKLIAKGSISTVSAGKKRNGKRIRRTGQELVQFRKLLKAQRKKGISVAELARKHGVSTAYIYMLP